MKLNTNFVSIPSRNIQVIVGIVSVLVGAVELSVAAVWASRAVDIGNRIDEAKENRRLYGKELQKELSSDGSNGLSLEAALQDYRRLQNLVDRTTDTAEILGKLEKILPGGVYFRSFYRNAQKGEITIVLEARDRHGIREFLSDAARVTLFETVVVRKQASAEDGSGYWWGELEIHEARNRR